MASRREQAGLPKSPELRALVLNLLQAMPMPVSPQQIGEAVAAHLNLNATQRAVREPGSERPYVDWQAGWACNDLKWVGACKQPRRGLYQLTDEGRTISHEEVEQRHRERSRRLARLRRDRSGSSLDVDEEDAPTGTVWQDDLINRLRNVSPMAFEHLAAALLRSAGFDDVEVTGRSGDGGIILTTGCFTRDARDEASRPGAYPVDLIDGEAFCELLREHSMGVRTTQRIVEDITVDDTYFNQFEDTK